jgi:pimeloyl-ACP methyl ester carboxylesterase
MTDDVGRDPTPFELSVQGRHVAGLDWGGEGTPLVLLHANGFCAGMYDPIARRLAGAQYHPFGIDLRGHGRTDPPLAPAEFAFPSVATELWGALGELGIAKAYVVGASFGGGVAVWLNALAPGLVLHAILAEAIAFDQQSLGNVANPMAEQTRRRRVNWPGRARRSTLSRTPPFGPISATGQSTSPTAASVWPARPKSRPATTSGPPR